MRADSKPENSGAEIILWVARVTSNLIATNSMIIPSHEHSVHLSSSLVCQIR